MRRALPMFAMLATLVVAACQFDEMTVAVQAPQVVVHAVLDPGAPFQQVLVERTLTGAVSVSDEQRFDPVDPINSGGGIPIGDCQVSVSGPDGVFIGEEALAPGKPFNYHTGRYVLHLPTEPFGSPVPLRTGGRYTLRVVSPEGNVVTGTTVLPYVFAVTGTPTIPFNRDRDSLSLSWGSLAGARSYLLRVESPFGPFLLFTDSTHVTLKGDLRNYFASSLEHVFIPGFRQRVSVAAVDSNYFDYYRTRNDPFTGAGIINRLQGGIGLFGAAVSVAGRTLDVVQDSREPAIEGVWDVAPTSTAARGIVDLVRIYVETPGEPAALSGWYARFANTGVLEGMVGTRVNGRIVLKLLSNQSASDTIAVFSGVQRGDSLIGNFGGAIAQVVFVKRPSQSPWDRGRWGQTPGSDSGVRLRGQSLGSDSGVRLRVLSVPGTVVAF